MPVRRHRPEARVDTAVLDQEHMLGYGIEAICDETETVIDSCKALDVKGVLLQLPVICCFAKERVFLVAKE